MADIKTGVRKSFNGHQAWFKIGCQTFFLQECESENGTTSKEYAKWYQTQLKTAFENLTTKRKNDAC